MRIARARAARPALRRARPTARARPYARARDDASRDDHHQPAHRKRRAATPGCERWLPGEWGPIKVEQELGVPRERCSGRCLPLACLLVGAAAFRSTASFAGHRLARPRSAAAPGDPEVGACHFEQSWRTTCPRRRARRGVRLDESRWWLMRTESSTRQHAELSRLQLSGALALPSTEEVALEMVGEAREWLHGLASPLSTTRVESARAWLEHSWNEMRDLGDPEAARA